MDWWVTTSAEGLWTNALGVIPIALVVALICRCLPCRSTTRHALWLVVLLWFLLPAVLPPSNVVRSLTLLLADSFSSTAVVVDSEDRASDDGVEAPAGSNVPRTTSIREGATRGADRPNRERVATRRGRARMEPRVWGRLAQTRRSVGPARDGLVGPRPLVTTPKYTIPAPTASRWIGGGRRATTVTPVPPSPWTRGIGLPRFVAPKENRRVLNDLVERAERGLSGGDTESESPAVVTSRTDQIALAGASELGTSASDVVESAAGVDAWRAWARGMSAIRDVVVQLSPIPTGLWVFGVWVCVGLAVLRIAVFKSRARRAYRAPVSVKQLVERCADEFGLRRAPEVLMIRDHVSPMIWCGRRVRMILPESLWGELDEAGRRAVVSHELAHVRRRDHWVNWIQLAVFAVYWWNPLVWWVRHHLSEEAELCCDAWVTWMYPEDRRAYAEALLRTKQYVNDHRHTTPVGCIGVTTGRAKRFARRIKMVMTERAKPGMSTPGILLALTLAVGGWVASPAWSCPKESRTSVKTCCGKGSSSCCTSATRGKCCGKKCEKCKAVCEKQCASVSGAVVVPGAARTYQAHVRGMAYPKYSSSVSAGSARVANPMLVGGAKGKKGNKKVARRMAELQRQIEELSANIADIRSRIASAEGHGHQHAAPDFRAPRTPRARRAPRAPRARRAPRGPRAVEPRHPGPAPRASGELEWRSYRLPEGKLAALAELMVRPDVPILVSPEPPDQISVQGTPRQHRVFAAFIRLIHRDGASRAAYAAPGPFDESVTVLEGAAVFTPGAPVPPVAPAAPAADTADRADASDFKSESSVLANVANALLEAGVQAIAGQEEEAQALFDRGSAVRRQSREESDDARDLRRKAEKLLKRADQLLERAEDATEEEAKKIRERADAVEAKADALDDHAQEKESRARVLAQSADVILESAKMRIAETELAADRAR